jgi:hypothetical protein
LGVDDELVSQNEAAEFLGGRVLMHPGIACEPSDIISREVPKAPPFHSNAMVFNSTAAPPVAIAINLTEFILIEDMQLAPAAAPDEIQSMLRRLRLYI